jgi:hypothetical protein
MRKITLMLFTLLLSFLGTAQVTVGSETATTTNLPITSCYGYTYSEQIFLASEINASGDITSLSFYLDAATSTADFSDSVGWTIYLGNTTKTDYASTTDWITSTGLTQVYTGDVAFPAEDNWVTITFDTPFTYSGIDNLVVAIDENTDSYDCSMYWRRSSTANDTSIYYRSDSTNPDPTAPPTANGTLSFRSNTIFGGIMQACPTPSDLTATNVTTTTADLGWTENGSAALWNIEVGVDGFTPTGTPTASGVTNPYIAMSLMPATDYQYYVQADCTGGELSLWAGPFGFTTACPIYTPDYDADMSDNAPNCWEEANSGDSTTGPMDLGAGLWYSSNHNGTPSNVINLYTTTRSDWIISPEFDLSTAAPSELNVYVALTENGTNGSGADLGSDDRVELLMTIDGGTTWTSMQSWSQGSVPTDVGEEITYDLSAVTGNVQFAFLGNEGTVNDTEDVYFHVSKFQVRETPSCLEPTAFSATNVTDTTLDLGWTSNGSETLWDIEVVDITAMGTATGAPTTSGVTTNPYTLTGLTDNNSYEVYVRADCSSSVSAWTGPVAFTTACAPIVPNYAADMSVNTPDACWAEAGSGDTTSGPMDIGASDWRQGTSYAYGSSNAINLYFNNDQEWLLSPVFDLSTGGPYQLDMNVAVTNWNAGTTDDTMGSDDEVQLLMSTDGGSTWSNLTTWNAANEPPVGGIAYVEDLTAITGNIQFAIYATDGATDDSEDYDFHIGRFEVRAIPSCTEPATVMNTLLTDTGSDFTWAAGGTETTWEYANLPSPSTEPASGTSTMAASASFSGLTPETDYDFYVRSDCGGTYSPWVLISYTTPPTPPANNDCSDAISLTPGADFDTNPVVGTNFGATGSGELPLPGCASYDPADASGLGGDVWYSVTVPSDGNLTLQTNANPTGNGGDSGMAVYSGTCGSLTLIECDDDDSPDGAYSQVVIEPVDALADQVVYVRVWEYGGNASLDFQVSAYSATLSVDDVNNPTAFSYYPNPVKNTLTLNAQNTIENVTMYNMLGQEVLRVKPNAIDSAIDMSNLETGTYFVQVTIASISKTIRVIKQ